jgi:hypothetical protein
VQSPFYNSNRQIIKPFAKLLIKRQSFKYKHCSDIKNHIHNIEDNKEFDSKDYSDLTIREKLINDPTLFQKKKFNKISFSGKYKNLS